MFMGFDIEVEPLPDAEILAIRGPFDPAKVNYGRLKDPAKKREKLEEEEAKYNDLDSLLMDARLSRICAIGVVGRKLGTEKCRTVLDPNTDEKALIADIWSAIVKVVNTSGYVVGFNHKGYDLPMLRRRSWLLGIKPPKFIIEKAKFWNSHFVDLLEEWRSGQTWTDASCGGLDGLARGFGLPPKLGSGEMFYKLLRSGDPVQVQQAIDYNLDEMRKILFISERMGLVDGV